MSKLTLFGLALAAGACAPQAGTAPDQPTAPSMPGRAADDGTFLNQIDPVGGHWQVEQLGGDDFSRFKGWVDFSAGGFLNHGAGCSGGYPAFYQLHGGAIAVTRREPIPVGKCAGTSELANGTPAQRQAAGDSERRLASFLDQLSGWRRAGDTLVLTARDGTQATLTRPVEPHPDIAGRWVIESIGGEPLVTERRPPILSIAQGSIGAHADCNSFGGSFTVPVRGQIAVSGPMVSTLIGCGPEDAAEDSLMARAISSATTYRLEGDRLILSGGSGLVARRPALPDRRLSGEYEHCGNTMLGAYHNGTIELAIDNDTIRDNVGCVASYTAQGPTLALDLQQGPACSQTAPPFIPGEPVEVGGDLSVIAITLPDGFGFRDDGVLVLRTNRGLLTMCRKGSSRPFGS